MRETRLSRFCGACTKGTGKFAATGPLVLFGRSAAADTIRSVTRSSTNRQPTIWRGELYDLELLARPTSRSIEMQDVVQARDLENVSPFVDRRHTGAMRDDGTERRQFVDSRATFRPEVI